MTDRRPTAAAGTAAVHGARRRPARCQRGLSMVEVLCVLAILLVLLGGALPLASDLRLGQRLQSVAALLETDLQLARSTAVHTGQPVRLVVQAPATGGSCYMLHNGAADACTCTPDGQARCGVGVQLLRIEHQPAEAGVALAALARPILFDGRKGTVTPTATLRLGARDGRAIHQVVNIMGRVRSCAPSGSVGGLRRCD
jgi:type IV fimbrial biogenesis protein FimT